MGQKVTIIDGLQPCSKLTYLNLRSNLLRRMIGVRYAKGLTYLELYDNRCVFNAESWQQLG